MHIDLGLAAAIALGFVGLVAFLFGNEDRDGKALLLACCCGGGLIAGLVINAHQQVDPDLATWMVVIGGVFTLACGGFLLERSNSKQRSAPTLAAATMAGFASLTLRMTQYVLVGKNFDNGHENQLAPSAYKTSNIVAIFLFVLVIVYIVLLIAEHRRDAREQTEDTQRSDDASRVQAPCDGNCGNHGNSTGGTSGDDTTGRPDFRKTL